jgi:hypothetical protein
MTVELSIERKVPLAMTPTSFDDIIVHPPPVPPGGMPHHPLERTNVIFLNVPSPHDYLNSTFISSSTKTLNTKYHTGGAYGNQSVVVMAETNLLIPSSQVLSVRLSPCLTVDDAAISANSRKKRPPLFHRCGICNGNYWRKVHQVRYSFTSRPDSRLKLYLTIYNK